MSKLRKLSARLQAAVGVGCRLLEPSSAKPVKEKANNTTSWSLKPLIFNSDSSNSNSGGSSDNDRPSDSTDSNGVLQDQVAIPTTTPQLAAAADEPYHVFGNRMKWLVVAQIGVAGTFSGLSSNIYFPCLKTITKEFGTSHQVASLTITSYQLIQGIAPLIWGTLSDKLGRRQVYVYSFTVDIAANIVLAFSPNLPVLFVFRGLQAFGSASVVSIGNGVIQDIALPVERGGFMSIYQALRMFSIAIGPVIGGALSQRWGFRSIFIILAVLAGLCLVQIIVFLPETLRSVVGNGSVRVKGLKYKPLWNLMSGNQSGTAEPVQAVKQKIELRDFWEPLCMLGEMDTLLNLLLGAFVYSLWSMMTGTTTMLLAEAFDIGELHIGLAYLPNGIGTCLGSTVAGWLMDRDYRSAEATYKDAHGMSDDCKISPKAIPGDFPIEKARFRHVFWITGLLAVFTGLYGAAFTDSPITSRREWIAVILALHFLIAAAANMIFAINSTLITDLHPGKGAGATAINNLARCTMSAGAVPLVHYLIKKFGTMPTFCAMAALPIFCVPMAIVSRMRGMKWRRDRMDKVENWESESQRSTGVSTGGSTPRDEVATKGIIQVLDVDKDGRP